MSFPAFSLRSLPGLVHPRGLVVLLALASVGVGCDRNIEPYRPGEEARPPDLARIFPGPPAGVGSAEAPSAEGGTSRAAVPPARAEASASRGGSTGSSPITGEIGLAPALASGRPVGAVLFVIARPEGTQGGPPLAVLRLPDPEFPVAFSIGPENVMIPSMSFSGPISLSARLDADGNAMTRTPGDIASPPVDGLHPGDAAVRLELSERS